MKPHNANSLRNSLALTPAESHPEADLLNGFAEGSLLADERRRVVQHLAGCESCRSAIALASDAAPTPAAAMTPARRNGRILRIAIPACSAAAAAAVTFVVMHHAPRDTKQPAVAAHTAVDLASPSRVTSAVPAVRSAAKHSAQHHPPRPAQAEPVPAPRSVDLQQEVLADSASRPAPAPQGYQSNVDASLPSTAFANSVTARALAKTAAAPLARPHWRINHQGQPERAFGSGAWQTVLPADARPMHVLATAGADVWIGGDNTQLYHSSDNGQTWSRIALPEKKGSVHTLAHIQIDSSAVIVIRASDETTWASSNGGASWK